jgi:hypothetical protein
MPRRRDDDEQSLFPADLRDLAGSIGLDWWAAKKLYDDKWLSFDPEINTINSSSKEAEFVFLGTLVAAGCDPRMLKRLLETLEKPYCYDLSDIYYDWSNRCWMDHDSPSQVRAKIVSEFEDDGDVDSLEELKVLVQDAINRLTNDEDVSCDRYAFNAKQDTIVDAAQRLFWKIAASALVDTPSKTIVVGKLFRVFQNLPKITLDEHLSLSLVGPRRKYGEHEIWHYWDIGLNEEGYLKISSAGHFYRPQTGGDSFTSMTWEVTPGREPELANYLHSLSIVDDADTFENEVEAMDFESGGYKLSVEDQSLEGLEAEDEENNMEEGNNMDEDNNADEATDAAVPWVLLPCDEADRRLAARIDHSEVDKREEQFAYGAEVCDFCKCNLGKRGLFVDGKVRNEIEWANMCAPCFEKNGDGIGWGLGQLYALQPNGDWRLVAGFEKQEGGAD